jgi:thiamine-monophosphate kinase
MSIEGQVIEYIKENTSNIPLNQLGGALSFYEKTTVDDDCVVINWPGDFDLVVGSDFVRGAGFRLFQKNKLSFFDIGYYLTAANASDLAAMGATPVGFLDVLRYTKEMTFSDARDIIDGILEACRVFKMPLLGGDTGGYELPVTSGAAVGMCKKGRALLRSNCKSGDHIYLSGPTGIAGVANAYFSNNHDGALSVEDEEQLLLSWRRINPQLDLGMFLVERGYSSCAMDTSDGLKASIEQLARASNIAIEIYLDNVPIDDLVEKVVKVLGHTKKSDMYKYVFSDSVDFRLLYTVPYEKITAFKKEVYDKGFGAIHIGCATEKFDGGYCEAVTSDGKKIALPGIGWDQNETPTHIRIEDEIQE